jgi:ribosomal protein S18 acetylase RimI-like enzyme
MAAVSDIPIPRVLDLRQIRGADLDYLLEEESKTWREQLDWDFQASAGLVRRFVDMQALSGFALVVNGRPIGYTYFVCEERKGLIGDLYVLREFATVENESRLLQTVLDTLVKTPLVRRIESQLMMLRNANRMTLPYWRHLRVFNRIFMEIGLTGVERLPIGSALRTVAIDNWNEYRQDEASALIANAYQGHIDSEINDQYRSAGGARRFLQNIIQYPGCGCFFHPASLAAFEVKTARMCGMCLSSLVSPDVGHITQICVSKAVRGQGVGYELIRRSMLALAEQGCRKASLTVTSSNLEAIQLYERLGFRTTREFAAYVWEGY